jgi:glucans biosynthesis protein C
MMWLGIVLHVAMNHFVGEFPAPWRDKQTTLVADLVLAFIHAFRMPVFFVIAGFFVALLMAQRGAKEMLALRMRRLALPFIVFWPILFSLTIVMVAIFMHQMIRGSIGIDLSIVPKPPSGAVFNTLHLWFLYMLIWLCIATSIIVMIKNRFVVATLAAISKCVNYLISNWHGVFVLTIPLAIVGSEFKAGVLAESGSFLPPLSEWVQHSIFFVAGLVFFSHKNRLLDYFANRCWYYLASGLIAFVAWLVLNDFSVKNPSAIENPNFWLAYAYNCCTWFWTFGIIGAFTRYFTAQGPRLKYLAESSYWVYLVHMLGTIGFGALMCNLPLPAIVKMLINIALTTTVCLLSYHFFVRNKVIGRLLNGNKLSQ